MTCHLDEDPDTCGKCPPQGVRSALPRTWEGTVSARKTGALRGYGKNSAQATLSCKHKVTKRTICAIPCDGIPDLCTDDIDEQCYGPRWEIVLGLTLILALIFTAFMFGLDKLFHTGAQGVSVEDFGYPTEMTVLLEKLIIHKTMWEIEESVALIQQEKDENIHYKQPLRDEYLLKSMGTNEMAAFYVDCSMNAFKIKVTLSLIKHLSSLFKLLKKELFQKVFMIIEHVICLVVRYSDFAKDLLLLYIIWI